MTAAFGGRGTICAVGARCSTDAGADEEGANGLIVPTGLKVAAVGGSLSFGCCVRLSIALIVGWVLCSFCGDEKGVTQVIPSSDSDSECIASVGTVSCAAVEAAEEEQAVSLTVKLFPDNTLRLGCACLPFLHGGALGAN